jgi:universal stress protein A
VIKLDSILVPVDFSDGSRMAFQYAATFCMEYGSKITVMHVVEEDQEIVSFSDPLNISKKWQEEGVKRAEDNFNALLGKYEKELDIKRIIKIGDPSKLIVNEAFQSEVDLVILGSYGKTGVKLSWLGGIAYNVVRKSPCPVLTVKPAGKSFVHTT